MEKFWASLLIIPIFVWYSYAFALDRDYKIKQQMVENVVYQYTQIAAKKGVLYDSVYNEMENKLSRFGVFDISVSAEKYVGESSMPVIVANSDVVNKNLRDEGFDIINIYVQSQNVHPLGRLYEMTPFGTFTGSSCEMRYFAKASVYIQ